MSKERFIKSYVQGNAFTTIIQILIDRETGVNYIVMKEGYGGGITPLLDANGNVVVTPINQIGM